MLFTLAAVQFTNILDTMIVMPLGPMLMRILSITPGEFSIIVSSYPISACISSFLGIFWIDKIDRKKALTINYSLFLIGTFLCALAESYELLVPARILTGIFGGTINAIMLSIVSDSIPAHRRGAAMGIVMTSFSMASVVGVPLGLFFANKMGWNAPFYLVVALGLVVIAGILHFIPSMQGHLIKNSNDQSVEKNPFVFVRDVFRIASQYRALILIACLILGQFSIIPFISAYLVKNIGLTEQEIPYVYALGGMMTVISMPLIGRLSDKIGKMMIFRTMAIFSVIPFILLTNLSAVSIYIALFVTSLFFIGVTGRIVPAQAMLTMVVPPQSRGRFMSLSSSIQQLAAGAAAWISGKIVIENDLHQLKNFNYVGYFAISLTLLALLIPPIISVQQSEEKELNEVETA